MYGWRGWVLCLGLLCGLNASAADEDYQRQVDDYQALVRRAETANTPELLLTSDAIQKVEALTDRRRLRFGSNVEDNQRQLKREMQVLQLMKRVIDFKPVQLAGEPDVHANTARFSAPLSRLSAHLLWVMAKLQDYYEADWDPDTLFEDGGARADARSDHYVGLLASGIKVTAALRGRESQSRLAEGLLEAGPSLLGAMRPAQRKRLLEGLEATYRTVDPAVRPPLDRFRQLLMSRECVRFCAVLSQ